MKLSWFVTLLNVTIRVISNSLYKYKYRYRYIHTHIYSFARQWDYFTLNINTTYFHMLTVKQKGVTMQVIWHLFPPVTVPVRCMLNIMIQYADAQVRRSFCRTFSNVAAHLWPLHLSFFSHYLHTIYKISVAFKFNFNCLSLLDLTEFLIPILILLCLTSILPPSGERCQKSTNKCKQHKQTIWLLLLRVCLDCFLLICQWKHLLRRGKEKWFILPFKAYVYLKRGDSSNANVNL